MGLRRRRRLCRHRIGGAPGALCTRRNALRRRSTAARRRPEASLGRSFRRASACWQDGRRSADCRRLSGPLRRGWRRRRRRGLPGPARVLRGSRSRNAICRLPSRYLRRTPVTGRVGLPPFPARGSARIVARHSLPHQPPHELPDRQVRIHVRQQLPQLLQSALALGVDHRLQLPASVPQRPQPLGGRRRLGIHLGQHLLHLPRALAHRALHELLAGVRIQHRHRRTRRLAGRRRGSRAGARRGAGAGCRRSGGAPPGSRRSGGERTASAALPALEGVLQQGGVAQVQRAVLQPLAHAAGLAAQAHGLDTAPRGGLRVMQLAHGVVEQAGVAAAQIEAPSVDLAQVVEDAELQRLLVAGEHPGLLQQHLIGEHGDGGEEFLGG